MCAIICRYMTYVYIYVNYCMLRLYASFSHGQKLYTRAHTYHYNYDITLMTCVHTRVCPCDYTLWYSCSSYKSDSLWLRSEIGPQGDRKRERAAHIYVHVTTSCRFSHRAPASFIKLQHILSIHIGTSIQERITRVHMHTCMYNIASKKCTYMNYARTILFFL